MNPRKWSSPHRVAVLALVILGGLAQFGAILAGDNGYLRGVGLALLSAGVLVELIGQWLGGRDK